MFRSGYNVLVEIAWCSVWLFLWPVGRISRRAYFISCLVVVAMVATVLLTADPSPPIQGMQTQDLISGGKLAALIVATAWSMFMLCAKRLHDCGKGGIAALCEPIYILMLVWPGDEKPNVYGDPTSILQILQEAYRR